MVVLEAANQIRNNLLDQCFSNLYGKREVVRQKKRYLKLLADFSNYFGDDGEVIVVSTPGRTEIGGNHTDHNAGHVLAAAVSLDVIATAQKNGSHTVTLYSAGYAPFTIDISSLHAHDEERFSSAALVRGILARCKELGYGIGGFNACVESEVLPGSGLSSSAAFEVMIVSVVNHLFNDGRINAIENAKIAQFAENNYFGKPCGLMDMSTCAVGNLVSIDFRDFDNPIVEKVDYDFEKSGYELIIIDTGGSHADLNEDYADIEHEMKACAYALGGQVLRDVSLHKLMENISALRSTLSDRAILRGIHFFMDDTRVLRQVDYLKGGDFESFKREIIASGVNSFCYCQNCFSPSLPQEQGLSIALAMSEELLADKGGAWRVHGGGFAGTIQCFVPSDFVDAYIDAMSKVFASKTIYRIMIRSEGTARII